MYPYHANDHNNPYSPFKNPKYDTEFVKWVSKIKNLINYNIGTYLI